MNAILERAGFVVRRRLGAGAFGTVFEVEDPARGVVAAKLLPVKPEVLRDDFERVAKIRHPNLARLHELRGVEDHSVVLMELHRGVDLLSAIRGPDAIVDLSKVRQGPGLLLGQSVQNPGISAFAPIAAHALPKLARLFGQLADALIALHEAGVVHRDVRPENVIVADERAVLVDLDLAREHAAPNEDEDIAGSPAYMAPDDVISPASDWYSFGVLLFEALTGALPFSGTAHEVIVRKRTVSAPSASFVVTLPSEADDLDALTVKLLRRVASMRPNGQEIRQILHQLVPQTS
ncbi:MAG: serine/threonine-protein kinase [Polyangiales bacterium]